MSKSPWGNIGAWAAEAERAEAEEREQAAAAAAAAAAAPPSVAGGGGASSDSQNYPSLREATSTKQKKKAAKMTLQEFTMQGTFGSGGSSSRLTPDEMLRLPTGPKERSAEEMQSGRLGGGFSNYGSRFMGPQPGRGRDRDTDGEGSWGNNRRSYGGFDDDRRGAPQSRASDFDQQPSRADEVDNWASTKKPLPSFDSNSTTANPARSRYAMLGAGGGASRADGDDNWAASKKPIAPQSARSSSFGSGFRDSRPEPERWTRGASQRLVLESPKSEQGSEDNVIEVTAKVNKPNPFGAARPREEVLAEKGLDWKKLDVEIDAKKGNSRPTSSHSSRPESSQSARSDGQALLQGVIEGVKPKAKVNPFGDAKPREVLLEEKGLDWRKIDLDLEQKRINRPETDEEKNLKKEIEQLKKEALEDAGEDQAATHDFINQKEKELELLIRDLDDKVRFGEKTTERPGSGSNRGVTSLAERPPSRPGSVDEHRSGEFMDRPRSRGAGDAWTGPVDDRRAFHGGRPGEDRRAIQGASPTEDRRGFQGARSNDDRRFFQGGRERRYFGNRNMERYSLSLSLSFSLFFPHLSHSCMLIHHMKLNISQNI
nr:eukaryotic translation initiation factor 4B2-like [Ipomoea batatas]